MTAFFYLVSECNLLTHINFYIKMRTKQTLAILCNQESHDYSDTFIKNSLHYRT